LAYQAFLCFIYTMSYLIVLSIAKQKEKGLENRLQNAELERAIKEIKQLSGMLPICAVGSLPI
jgi:hypothetical protein